jgi:polyisoprenoid-binding protein YceI
MLGTAIAQQTSVTLMDKSTMQIEGTSNVHDWTADVEQLNFDITLNTSAFASDSLSNPVETLSLTIPVDKMESGKGGLDRRMHDALKKDDHPNIIYELSSSEVTETSDSTFQLKTTGTVTIAGVSRDISFPVQGTVQDDGTYKFTGDYEINMEDYDVDPPTAMFGAVRSGEMVTISFELFFKEG